MQLQTGLFSCWIVGFVLGIIHILAVYYMYIRVPKPYMDEIFHIDQSRRFCSLDFSWNEKITTPPALYILSLFGFCGYERYTNSLLIPFFYVGAIRFRMLFTREQLHGTALVVLFLPVLFHSTLLFYTDLLSITTLLWGFSCLSSNYAFLFFLIAVLTRQTNIVWAGLYGVVHLIQLISPDQIFHSIVKACFRLWALILLALGFILFFILNGFKIVLGDHDAHQPQLHFMQIYYFFAFAFLSAAPQLCLFKYMKTTMKDLMKKPFQNFVFCIVIMFCICFFTFEHPYLLADNRHFTFYIWRKWFRRHWSCRYILAPCYLFSMHMIKHSVRHIEKYKVIFFLLATVVVLVPLPLLEPRYYIVPFVLWRLCLIERGNIVLFIEILYNCFINIAVLYLFFQKPFLWDTEPEELQRFMW